MIAIIDYGVGNLRSVEKAFHFIGSDAVITSDPEIVLNADAVVLPGVGAFADAMDNLAKSGMAEVIKETIAKDKPFFGICLGMQLLFDYSEEGGKKVKGLGIFRGSIRLIPRELQLKVPHMGWNSLKITGNGEKLFKGLGNKPYVYFVHSYYLKADDRSIVAATVDYGLNFDAAISSGNIHATQFHPEKSGKTGLAVLKNFVDAVRLE